MAIRKSNLFLTIVNGYVVDSLELSNISYWWNLGSLLGVCLVIQLATGIFLAMHVRCCASFTNQVKVWYLFVHKIKSLYLSNMWKHLLNIACREKVVILVKLLIDIQSDETSNLWLKLYYLKFNLQQHQAECLYLDSNGDNKIYNWVGVHDSVRTINFMYSNNITIKGMSEQSKEVILGKNRTTVSTKECELYVEGKSDKSVSNNMKYINFNRLRNNNLLLNYLQKRDLAIIGLRSYSTESGQTNKNVLDELNSLHEFSKNYLNKRIDRKIYNKFMLSKELYILAYQKLRSNLGMMTLGIYLTTLDGISDETLEKIINDLRSNKFKFTLYKRIDILKLKGGTRLLNLGNLIDKLVQEVMRMVLEAIYELLFSNNSHGFRRNRSCHTALRYIFTQFKGCTWWIEGDISKCFDSILHNKLINCLEEKIDDKRFIDLIRKALNAGYLIDRRLVYDIVGTLQGSIISLILANIYLSKLDKFIEELKLEHEDPSKKGKKIRLKEYRSIERKIGVVKKLEASNKRKFDLRKLSTKLRNTKINIKSSYDNKLMYVRYVDDWIVAINGTYSDAELYLNKIRDFCKDHLGLTVSLEKTKITNSYKNHILFLGTNIKHSSRRDIVKRKGNKTRSLGFLMLTALMKLISKKLALAGFHRYHKGLTKTTWLELELSQIIYLANSIIRGYLNYYSFVYNRNRLTGYVYYIIRDSVLRTFAAKMRLKTRAQVIKKYGLNLTIYDYSSPLIKELNKKLAYKEIIHLVNVSKEYKLNVWNFKIKNLLFMDIPSLFSNNVSLATVLASKCKICGSTYRVEMHHIRELKDIRFKKNTVDYIMSKARRKQILLCRECHMKYHSGNLHLLINKSIK